MTPYNLSPKSVERMKDELEKLLSGDIVTFTTQAPHTLTYRLREAIAAAISHGIEPYASIAYKFRIEGPTNVRCIPKVGVTIESADIIKGVKTEKIVADDVNEFDVIIHATKLTEDRVVFKSFIGQAGPVKTWASKHGFAVEEDPMVLTKVGGEDAD